QGPHDTLSEAINAAVEAGTVAVIAAGNAGPGILTVESPGNAANAITAAAASDPHFEGIKVTFGTTTIGAAIGQFANLNPAIPAVLVSRADGATLKAHAPGSVKVDGSAFFDFVTTNADVLAAFSSRGPTPYDFRLKPDVTAPGVNVLSSVFGGQFSFFQGTSM